MIHLGNGVLLTMGGRSFRFDPRRLEPGDVSMISHAHSDHLPTSFRCTEAICSPITRDFVLARRRKEIGVSSDTCVRSFEAGHIAGSKMFMVKGEKTVLYTGDFCTRDKVSTKAAKPHKCDILITEATYGKPQYVFPDHAEVLATARDWLDDTVRKGKTAVLFAYPLGKSQELTSSFRGFPLALHPTIAQNNRLLRPHGYDLCDSEYDPAGTRPPFVYITSGMGKDREIVRKLANRGAKTAAFSGWTLDRGFAYRSGVDEAFALSDHCGYDELLEFVRKCSPEKVFTQHGFAKEFAHLIRRELGIPAQPLVAKQHTLDHFC
jgi:putative mRNA 3-end processing factor